MSIHGELSSVNTYTILENKGNWQQKAKIMLKFSFSSSNKVLAK